MRSLEPTPGSASGLPPSYGLSLVIGPTWLSSIARRHLHLMPRNIVQDNVEHTVVIDGMRIPGSLDEHRRCRTCGSARVYHDDYDAHFCPTCNVWLESACSDPSCDYCRRRPQLPLPAEA